MITLISIQVKIEIIFLTEKVEKIAFKKSTYRECRDFRGAQLLTDRLGKVYSYVNIRNGGGSMPTDSSNQ